MAITNKYDMPNNAIGFNPLMKKYPFKCFWSVDGAWGTVKILESKIKVKVLFGELAISTFILPDGKMNVTAVKIDGKTEKFSQNENKIKLAKVNKISTKLCIDFKTEDKSSANT